MALNLSSGEIAFETSSNEAVTILAAQKAGIRDLTIYNEGAAAGFFSTDGGTVWHRLPASTMTVATDIYTTEAIKIKRQLFNVFFL